MKRNIFFIVGIILSLAILGGVGYYFLNKKEYVPQNKEENKETLEDKKNKQLQEYYEYLSYVPEGAYTTDYIDVETISKKYLLGLSLDKIMIDKKVGNKKAYFQNEDIDTYLTKMYNLKLSNYDLTKFGPNPFENLSSSLILKGFYTFNNQVFNSESFREEDNLTRYIGSYRTTENELIIYEYVLKKYGDNKYRDLYVDKDIEITSDVLEYLKENLINLTQYKHTFKKNKSGYYWYSTEPVNDIPLTKTYIPNMGDNEDNRSKGEVIELTEEIKTKTLDFFDFVCNKSAKVSKYSAKNYYPNIWAKFDYAVSKLIEAENITYCPMDYSSEECNFDLERIKPYYVKYFGTLAYQKDVNSLIKYSNYDPTSPRYKDNKYFLMTGCGGGLSFTNYYEDIDHVIKLDNKIEVYVKVGFIAYENSNDLIKQLYYKDYNENELIYETPYFIRSNYEKMITTIAPTIKNNFATYKYVLPKEGDNYYFDHIERLN